MHSQFFDTEPLPGNTGYTYTLATRLSDMLNLAESLYGPRDHSFTFVGIEFRDGNPQTWFPGFGKHVAIQLGNSAKDDLAQALFHLSHECIHLLAPTHGGANILEEGLATVFSEDYVVQTLWRPMVASSEPYRIAAELVRRLLQDYPDSIKQVRAVSPNFKEMTVNHFLEVCPGVDANLIAKLLMPFSTL